MYVPQGSVPQNSMSPMSPQSHANYQGRIMQTDRAATKAFLAVECPPNPISFPDQPRTVQQQVVIAQARGLLPGIAAGPNGLPTSLNAPAPGSIAAASLAGNPTTVSGNPVPTLADVKQAVSLAPQVVPLNASPQTPGCQIQYRPAVPPMTPQPQQLKPAPTIVKSTGMLIPPVLTLPAVTPPVPATLSPSTPPNYANNAPGPVYPPANPCAPYQFVGYKQGGPVCFAGYGAPPAAAQGPMGYASISGLGDVPPWGDVYVIGCKKQGQAAAPNWIGWALAAALGIAVFSNR